MAILENTVKLLERKCDDNEQYSRRTSLRINNIAGSEGRETAEQCVDKVVETVNKIPGVKVKKDEIDRAHRVGVAKAGYPRQMIVKFKYWNTRSMVYKRRKDLEDNRIYLDLTKRRLDLKNLVNDRISNNDKVDFVFADINCSLSMKLQNGQFKYFNSQEEFESILTSL